LAARAVPWLLLIAAVAGGAAIVVTLTRALEQAEALATSASQVRDAATEELATVRRSRAEAEANLDRLMRENEQLYALQSRLREDVATQEEEIARLKGTFDKLQEKMKEELKSGAIKLSQEGDRLRVGLIDKILFSSGEAEITESGKAVLRRVGQVLASVEDRQIQVSGHTDTTPPGDRIKRRFPTNWELSVARATGVVRFLSEEVNIPGTMLVASGYGEHAPIATNSNPRGRAKNRRIEILLVPALQPVKLD
jgi:chemotaxis protein MotB